jgi:hypothetical protein
MEVFWATAPTDLRPCRPDVLLVGITGRTRCLTGVRLEIDAL